LPITYTIDHENRLVVCTGSGLCTADDVLGCHAQLVKDAGFDPSFSQLVDGTAITGTTVTAAQMRALAGESPFSLDSRRAMVADSPLGFGLSRIYQIVRSLRGDRHIRVFHSRGEAMAWLLREGSV
jgi:hypothetical protein